MKKNYTMRKIYLIILLSLGFSHNLFSQVDTLGEASVVSFYRNSINPGSLLRSQRLREENYGQEPSHLFRKLPSIFSMSDNGTEFGYGYFRIRGLDQTRINVTLDGMPWNEAEDYGTYFANSPDLMSSLHSIKVERGSSSSNNGTASSGGSINLESVDLLRDTTSFAYIGGGSFKTMKTSVIYNSGLIGKSAFHIKGTQQQTEGFRDYGFNNSQALSGKYGYFFSPAHSIDILTLNGRHRNGQGWLGNTMSELTSNPRSNGNIKSEDDEWFQSINKIQYRGQVTPYLFLTSSVYLQYQKGWYNMDLDNYMKRMVTEDWDNSSILYSYGLKHYLYGGNIASRWEIKNFHLQAGVNIYRYQRQHYMEMGRGKNIPADENYDNTGYKNDLNVFLSGIYRWKGLEIGGNIQYRYVDFTYKDNLHPDIIYNEDTRWNFVNYGLDINYSLQKGGKFYIRFAAVSREPTRTDMFGGNEFYPGEITSSTPERSYDIEAGHTISTSKIKANVNLYYMRFTNERVLTGEYGLNGLPLHESASNSFRSGIEASLNWNFISSFYYDLSGSWSIGRVNSKTFQNKNHILTPSLILRNELGWNSSRFTLGLEQIYRSEMYMDQENENKIPWYLVFNFHGSFRYRNMEVGLRIGNIFNRVNFYNAALGAKNILWFREAGTNAFVDFKIYF